ncbi:MAG: hypothetical protein SFT93_04240 [Rickettsiaceae bacterium]|nr:hypothetical protein [Rickettsiaceae bacterium]
MKPVLFGILGYELSNQEKNFFEKEKPLGFVIFKRNIQTLDQLKTLIESLKKIAGSDVIIAIDQEGGRVQRLNPNFLE